MEKCPGGGLNQEESKLCSSTGMVNLKQKGATVETLPEFEPVIAWPYLVFMQLY